MIRQDLPDHGLFYKERWYLVRIKTNNRFKWKFFKYTVISILSVLVFLGIWELCTDGLHLVSAMALPSPVKIFKTFISKLSSRAPDGATLPEHFLASLKLTFSAYISGCILGTIVGILMGWYKPVNTILRPLVDFIRPIPPIALIPVMIMVLGIGFTARASIIFLSVFNTMLLNSYSGIRQTKDVHLWVGRTFGASDLQQLFTIAIPSAKPMIFTGLQLAMTSSWMCVVAAEMLAAGKGLGYMINIARQMARADIVILGILTLGLIGLAISKGFDALEKVFLRGGT